MLALIIRATFVLVLDLTATPVALIAVFAAFAIAGCTEPSNNSRQINDEISSMNIEQIARKIGDQFEGDVFPITQRDGTTLESVEVSGSTVSFVYRRPETKAHWDLLRAQKNIDDERIAEMMTAAQQKLRCGLPGMRMAILRGVVFEEVFLYVDGTNFLRTRLTDCP